MHDNTHYYRNSSSSSIQGKTSKNSCCQCFNTSIPPLFYGSNRRRLELASVPCGGTVNRSIFQGGAVQVDVGRIRITHPHTNRKAPPPIHAILYEENCGLLTTSDQIRQLTVRSNLSNDILIFFTYTSHFISHRQLHASILPALSISTLHTCDLSTVTYLHM